MKLVSSLLGILAVSFFISCQTEPNSEAGKKKNVQNGNTPSCLWTVNSQATSVSWTAYKTTKKVPVKGNFELLTLNTKKSATIPELIESARFSIPTSSVNTKNPGRDSKIQTYFFEKLTGGSEITGKILSVDKERHMVRIELDLNGYSKELTAKYELVEGTILSIRTDINLEDWGAAKAIKSLNDACYDLHKGADGKSKLWPEVSIEIQSSLVKECR